MSYTITNRIGLTIVILLLSACMTDLALHSGDQESTSTPMTTSHSSLLMEPTWAVLFSGDDLSSFNEIGGANWVLDDGQVSASDGEPGFLVTRGRYTDFILKATFIATSSTNSGIFIRCEDPDSVDANSCYEINIFDNNQNPDFKTGSILRVAAPLNEALVGTDPATLMISAIGDHIQVWVNDTLTADVHNSLHASGNIALQFNSGYVSFSEILFRPE
jgi:hypothetical protein